MSLAWVSVAVTIVGTVYGQLMLKYQLEEAGELPDHGRVAFLLKLLLNPWVISVWVAAAIAALAWMRALAELELGRAYPFVGLTFIITLLGSAAFFSEQLTPPKVVGTIIIVAGIAVASQG